MIALLAYAALTEAASEALRDPTSYSIQCSTASPDGRHFDFSLLWDRGPDRRMIISLIGTDKIMSPAGVLNGSTSAGETPNGTHALEMRVLDAAEGPLVRFTSRANPYTYAIDLHVHQSKTFAVVAAGQSLIPSSFGTIAVGWCKDIPRAPGAKK